MTDKKALKEIGRKISDFGQGFLEGHLIIPSCLRKMWSVDSSGSYALGAIFPVGSTLVLGIYPLIGYFNLFIYDKKIATATLATQLTTNIASGLYEWYRYEENKLNKPSINPDVPKSGLEKKAEEKVETQPVKSNFINPWEIEIPKLDKND